MTTTTTSAPATRDPDRLDTPPFTIEAGKITRQGSTSSRTLLGFAAPAARHLDGGLEVNVYAVLFDAQGRFIGRRSHDRNRTVLGSRAQWLHEIDNDWLAQAARITYELEYRFDHRRKILGGELPQIPAEADGSDHHRWLNLDPRALEDRIVRIDFALWVRSSELVITISQQPKFSTDSCRTDFELDLIDADQQLAYTRTFSTSLNCGQPSFDDTAIGIERRALRPLRFFELRGRTEGRGIARWSFDVPA
jgi:hypothetical protein